MASIIIADENEGRRNLLANTFEREGYDVTRLGTLTQTEATAGAVLPDVLLLEGDRSRTEPLSAPQLFCLSTIFILLLAAFKSIG